MENLWFFAILLLISANVSAYKRVKRGVPAGPSDFYSPKLSGSFLIQDIDSGYCIGVEGNILKAVRCKQSSSHQQWQFHQTYLLQNLATGTCLSATDYSYTNLKISSCASNNLMKWKCNNKNGNRPGIKIAAANKCLRLKDINTADLQPCDHQQRGQGLKIYGTSSMLICTRQTDVGTRTRDPNYYLLKSELWELNWPMKYVKIFLVYNKDSFNIFKGKYGTDSAALSAIKDHAVETISILDKAYRQIKVRMLLVGFEVWNTGDKITVTNKYFVLKSEFRTYSFETLRKRHLFDTSVLVYGGHWDGAWSGAGMSDMCKAFEGNKDNEVFVMASHRSTSAFALAHLLSHEFGHQFNMGHPFEPDNPCPTYRLYGTFCTMGGNSWPKGFSAQFLKNIRRFKYSCLDRKPDQASIVSCGNGVIDNGEECDCGRSQDCLTNNPCCDGSLCKLKKGAQCSSETCCRNCKFDDNLSGCGGNIVTLTDDSGTITQPSATKNVNTHWKIEAPKGKRIKLFFNFENFEFKEECPYDFVEVRDGGTKESKLLGKYCRTPENVFLVSSGRNLFVTFHSDGTFASSFKLFYQVTNDENDGVPFHVKHSGGKCVTFDESTKIFRFTTACTDMFSFLPHGNLFHHKTKKCVQPRGHGNGNDISVTADCESMNTIFSFTSKFSLFHGLTGKCIHPKSGHYAPKENSKIVLYAGCNEYRLKFEPLWIKTPVGGDFHMKHYGGKCITYDKSSSMFNVKSTCVDKFSWLPHGHLLHQGTNKCVKPSGHGNGHKITVTEDCNSKDTVFTLTSKSSLKHTLSGKCIHPRSGYSHPPENDLIVIYAGCDENRLKFEPVWITPPYYSSFIIKHYGGLCMTFKEQNGFFSLTKSCSDKFRLVNDHLYHLSSNKCLKPQSWGNSASIVLTSDCTDSESKFEQTRYFSIKHSASRKCFHPYGGYSHPSENTRVVLWSGCNQSRLQFRFLKG